MFNSIQGEISGRADGELYIMTGGIEWAVLIPDNDSESLPPSGERTKVWTWLYHKEDGMRLFGFASEARRATFVKLLTVDGIGPKGALKIMSGIGQDDLEKALDEDDLMRLERVPGLGRKTAQKLLLTLKGKLTRATEAYEKASPYTDLVNALTAMGYDKRKAGEALERLAMSPEVSAITASAEREKTLFRLAILHLSNQ